MKYIFDLFWFNNVGQTKLKPGDYQTKPAGGWDKWTPDHNIQYMQNMIQLKENFMLVGDINTLIGQARNAGDGDTRCMVGAEALILFYYGYTVSKPINQHPSHVLLFENENEDEGFQFDDINNEPLQQLLNDARAHLVNKENAKSFWTDHRKKEYCYLLTKAQ